MTSVSITSDFGYVILVAIGMAVQLQLTGSSVSSQRKKHGVKYPDMGSGRYAAKLNDKDWEEFNNYQRAHYNYLEAAPGMYALLFSAGATNPKLAASLGFAYMVGRSFYSRNYVKNGAESRYNRGAPLMFVGQIGLLGVAAFGAIKMLGFF
ncbi:hypothetical protein HK096_005997 [Nowakowskiella sp. JEL0078]|nr:hypothetical protein HK096_005997 [Nowakowskiella sp. JEL0078]